MSGKVIIISSNTAQSVWNYRRNLITALCDAGYTVHIFVPNDATLTPKITDLGCTCHDVRIDRHGMNPFLDIRLLWRYVRLLLKVRADVLLNFTIKPNIYGSIAALLTGVSVINNITGAGSVFSTGGVRQWLVELLYKASHRAVHKVFFQNANDKELFERKNLIPTERTGLLPGSGVDLERFVFTQMTNADTVTFLYIGRMLRDKGVLELIQATHIVAQTHPQVRLTLAGPTDDSSPAAIAMAELQKNIADATYITYVGMVDDVVPYIQQSDCIVLPSYYREGTPRSILEAMAMGRPVITTDVPGCRDTVDSGINGLLIPPRDTEALEKAMNSIMRMPQEARMTMGIAGRQKVEKEFDEHLVINAYLSEVTKIMRKSSSAGVWSS